MAAILRGRSAVGIDPHAGVAGAAAGAGQAEVGERVDESCSTRAHVGDGVGHAAAPLAGHGEDRVADELAGPVVGDVAAPVGRAPARRRPTPAATSTLAEVGPDAERVDVRVLEQQQLVVARRSVEQAVLERVRVAVAAPCPATGRAAVAPWRPPRSPAHASSASQSRVSMISLTSRMNAAA